MSIWLDVTTVLNWTRPAVGIVRMEAEVARYFFRLEDSGLKFCYFDGATKAYIALKRNMVLEALERLDNGHACVPAADTVMRGPGSRLRERAAVWRDRLYAFAQRAVFSFSQKIIDRFPQQIVSCAFRLKRMVQRLRVIISAALRKIISVSEPTARDVSRSAAGNGAPFEDGDVYITLGLDWDQKDLAYIYDLKKSKKIKVIQCCYDIIPILFPEYCSAGVPEKFPGYFIDVAWCADKVLCISECSKRDLIAYLCDVGAPVPDMDVVTLGCDVFVNNVDMSCIATDLRLLCRSKYILYVSTIEARKNHQLLLDAYDALLKKGIDGLPLLVFVGMRGWGVDGLFRQLENSSLLKSHVRILNHVSDAELCALYKHALFCVYPSLYEGWGLPVAECLAYGKYCLAAPVASIPEVGGSFVEYLDPHDCVAWASRMLELSSDNERLQGLEDNIRAHYVPVSWDETGRQIHLIANTLR